MPYFKTIRIILFSLLATLSFLPNAILAQTDETASHETTFIFASDVHFGLSRLGFRGKVNVPSKDVNAAMLSVINSSSHAVLPNDNGVRSGQSINGVDFFIITGDLTNRQELYPIKIQSAEASWKEFEACYIRGLTLKTNSGAKTPLLLVPGNHDVSNAIGSPSKLVPATDATSMAQLYNRFMHPAVLVTKDTYNFKNNRIYYSENIGGAHEIFVCMWPDSTARNWIEEDLKSVPKDIPVFIFCHDPPAVDARHLTNPHGNHDINRTDKFENVLCDIYADGGASDGDTDIEQRQLASFIKAHPQIVAYFHGHENFTQFYTWKGPDENIQLNTFRSDSPMKGKVSGKDETKLAFQVVTFDTKTQLLTSRECLWNTKNAEDQIIWGKSATVSIAVHH
jgi:hypothetical protein